MIKRATGGTKSDVSMRNCTVLSECCIFYREAGVCIFVIFMSFCMFYEFHSLLSVYIYLMYVFLLLLAVDVISVYYCWIFTLFIVAVMIMTSSVHHGHGASQRCYPAWLGLASSEPL